MIDVHLEPKIYVEGRIGVAVAQIPLQLANFLLQFDFPFGQRRGFLFEMFFLPFQTLNAANGGLKYRQIGGLGIVDIDDFAQIGEAFPEVGPTIFFQSIVRLARVFAFEPTQDFGFLNHGGCGDVICSGGASGGRTAPS